MTVTRNDTRNNHNISISEKANIRNSGDSYSVNQSLITKYKSALKERQTTSNNKPIRNSESVRLGHSDDGYETKRSVYGTRCDDAVYSPCFNKGGRYFGGNVSIIDWLRATSGDDEYFQNFMFEVVKLLQPVGFKFVNSGKGIYGYKQSEHIILNDKRAGNTATVNNNKEGGLFELSGYACQFLQLHHPEKWSLIHTLLTEYKFRFTRLDIALDFHSEYALEKGYTVPSMAYMASEHALLNKDTQRGKQSLKGNTVGDWFCMTFGETTAQTYDPLTQCQQGLTAYFGTRKTSSSFFRIYEKGKEQDSALADGDADRAYFRIEEEIKNPNGNRPIPLAAMVNPDNYFGEGRPKLRLLLDEMRSYYGEEAVSQYRIELLRKQKAKSLNKKISWGKNTIGRLINTLSEVGMSNDQIIKSLKRSEGLTEYVNDLSNGDDLNLLDALIIENVVPVNPRIASDRVSLDVSQDESGKWIAERVPEVA